MRHSGGDEVAAAPLLPRFILAVVIGYEENLSRRRLARLLGCAHLD
jgi:hypothetical protein